MLKEVSKVTAALARRFDAQQKALSQVGQTDFRVLRKQAWQAFLAQGLPERSMEAYRHAVITPFLARHHKAWSTLPSDAQGTGAAPKPLEGMYHLDHAYHVVTYNGWYCEPIVHLPAGLCLKPLSEIHSTRADLLKQHFAQHAACDQDPFVAMNTALFAQGILLEVKAGTVLDKPLVIHHVLDAKTTQLAVYPRLLAFLGQDSHLQLVETCHVQGSQISFMNRVAEVVLEQKARLDHYVWQRKDHREACQFWHTQVHQGARSYFSSYTLTTSASALIRHNLWVKLAGLDAEARLHGLYDLEHKACVDHHVVLDHMGARTKSQTLYKGMIDDQATGVFISKVHVQPEARQSNAWQKNQHLMLSDHAFAHAQPHMEIYTDDVTCTHGATTGQLDAEQRLYLQTRGIPETMAEELLKQAFCNEVIASIPLKTLRQSTGYSALI